MDYRDVIEFFKDSFKYLIVIILVLLVAIYVFSFQQVIGPSMKPTLQDGDILILNKIIYKLKDVKRNDIVALRYAKDEKIVVKRIVGLPGETIEFKDLEENDETKSILYINGKGYEEEYLNDVYTKEFNLKDLGYDTIPKDMYLVLGDNRGNSMDSREFGLVKKKDIVGRVKIRLFPFNNINIVK